jgi:hypothetical protein
MVICWVWTKYKGSRANICCCGGIIILCVFRGKPRYLSFSATNHDIFKFPRWIAISTLFSPQILIFQASNIEVFRDTSFQRPSWPIIIKVDQTFKKFTKRYKCWPNVTKAEQTLQKLSTCYKSWANVTKVYQTLQKLTKRYKSWPNVIKLNQTLQNLTKRYKSWSSQTRMMICIL